MYLSFPAQHKAEYSPTCADRLVAEHTHTVNHFSNSNSMKRRYHWGNQNKYYREEYLNSRITLKHCSGCQGQKVFPLYATFSFIYPNKLVCCSGPKKKVKNTFFLQNLVSDSSEAGIERVLQTLLVLPTKRGGAWRDIKAVLCLANV